MSKSRILIVGAGIGGLTTALSLARRGFSIDVIEQGAIPNPASSSFDEHRVIRHAYGPHRGYGLMMPAAFAAWERLWSEIGARHFRQTGSIFTFRGDASWLKSSTAVMRETGAVLREIDLDRLALRVPMLRAEGVTAAFETEGDGILFNRRILADLVVHLARRDVRFHPFTKVIDVDGERGRVRTDRGDLPGDGVIVAAGAWLSKLLPEFGREAIASRQAVVYVAPPARFAADWARAPVMVNFDGDRGTYTIPPGNGTRPKIGDHVFTRSGDPDGDRIAGPLDLARLLTVAAETYRDFDQYTLLELKICFYTIRDGERFLVAPIGSAGYVLSACSGHGFKFAPLIAEGLAAAIAGERTIEDVSHWAAGQDA